MYTWLTSPSQHQSLSVEHKLQADAEVLRCDRVGRRGEQRLVHLSVVVARQCEELAQCVIGREGHLYSLVTTCGLRELGQDVAVEGTLIAEGNVQTQVEVVGKALAIGGRLLLRTRTLTLRSHRFLGGKEVEVRNFVTQSDDKVIRTRFVDLL